MDPFEILILVLLQLVVDSHRQRVGIVPKAVSQVVLDYRLCRFDVGVEQPCHNLAKKCVFNYVVTYALRDVLIVSVEKVSQSGLLLHSS